jgi:histidinol-phosphate aminotransferase
MSISRRSLLKGGLLATTAIPFLNIGNVAAMWRADAYATPPSVNGDDVLVKLNSNENPYGPSGKARQAIIDAIPKGNRYPRSQISKLEKQIAAYEKLSPDQVVITAGSTELLGVFGLLAGIQKGRVIGCTPTFDFMLYYAEKFSAEWVKVPVTEDHQYNLTGIEQEITDDTRLVFICNPNNPTGAELSEDDLKLFCTSISKEHMVYVDEAYIEFSKGGVASSLAGMTRSNKNLVIGRTFSKIYGLAGMRIGYAIGHPETIKNVRSFLQGRSMTPAACSIAAASASLGDEEFMTHCRKMNDTGKDLVYAAFEDWGVEYVPSSTSFILFKTEKFENPNIRVELQRKNILIRDYKHVPGWARVSIGTPDEMKVFVKATKKFLA